MLKSAGQQLVSVLLTAGSLVGFVAFAGGVIVWTRFAAAQVPPDQAVNAVPRDELVSIGTSILLVFGFFGALALLVMYLIDRGGRATPGMSRGLLCLLAIEGGVAIALVSDRPLWQLLLAGAAFAAPLVLAFVATFAGLFVRYEDKLPSRADEALAPERVAQLSLEEAPKEGGKKKGFSPTEVALGAVVIAASGVLLWFDRSEALRIVVAISLVILLVGLAAYRFRDDLSPSAIDPGDDAASKGKEDPGAQDDQAKAEAERLKKRRPFRLELRPLGAVLLMTLLGLAIASPSLILAKLWLAGSLVAAVIVVAGLWRIAGLSKSRFSWYGLAVFISVPLFGTLTTMAHNLDDPQAQPMALIRNTDGPDEAIQGLYVTETDDRVYFATLATEGCGDAIVEHSGRLLWVPRSEVVAMSIGPLEDVGDARTTALEMAYALTPVVETPAGDHVSLTPGEKRAESTGAAKAKGAQRDQRLENVGAAVRPNFGLGLRLVPEDASGGDIVTLRMSRTNADVEGFGKTREGRTLRLGGVPVPIVREKVRSAEDAEFVKTAEGKVLPLDKEGVYERVPGEGIVSADDELGDGDEQFVKLGKDSGVKESSVKESKPGDYLELDAKGGTTLAEGQTVSFVSGEPEPVEPRLLRQAWHENHIKFRVPDNASTGVVSVECEQLAGQPLLRVARPPVARIAVRMSPGSPRVVFDSQRSSDGTGKIVSRRWTIEGLHGAHGDRVATELPARSDDYAVGLTVTDAEGQADTAWMHILRLPADLMRFEEGKSAHPEAMQRARAALLGVVSRDAPAAVEFDAVPEAAVSPGPDLTLKGAEAMRESLLNPKADAPLDPNLTVRTLAYEQACPFQPGEGGAGGVDIVTLSGGVQVVPPQLCPPDRVRIAHGWPPTQP